LKDKPAGRFTKNQHLTKVGAGETAAGSDNFSHKPPLFVRNCDSPKGAAAMAPVMGLFHFRFHLTSAME
jgi:hypothetical protein